MADPNTNYSNLSAVTQQLFIPKLVDNVFNSNALLQRWRKSADIKDGGTKIVQPVLYAKTTATGWYSGAETLATAANDKRTAAEFDWKTAHASITITREDELKNSGSSQVIDHVKTEIQVAEKTLADTLGTALFNVGTDSKAPIGLRLMCAGTGSTYGGISKTDYSWWRGTVATDAALTLALMQSMDGDLTIGSDSPSVLVTTQDIYDDYYNLLQPQQRFTDSKTADGGFQNLMFKSKPLIVDSHCPTSHLFFLNEKYISLVIHKMENFRFEPFVKPTNQNAAVAHVYFAGALTGSNCRMQGMFTSLV